VPIALRKPSALRRDLFSISFPNFAKAADAARGDHARLMKSVYWGAPTSDQGELIAAGGDQQRLAS